ncbi:MAG: glutathione S-transferase family protein [Steroidobacteraceae bacterium]
MAIEVYWGSGSVYSWRVLLALEFKQLRYLSRPLDLAKQEHCSPEMLKLNPRGRVPVLKEGEYVCYEPLAILTYLDRQYPKAPLFGRDAEEAGNIMRSICEFQVYVEGHINKIITAIFLDALESRLDQVRRSLEVVVSEAHKIENVLLQAQWPVGDQFSAVDVIMFPSIKVLQRALARREADELVTPFEPLEIHFPAIAAWVRRVEALPGYERTYPPHWRS